MSHSQDRKADGTAINDSATDTATDDTATDDIDIGDDAYDDYDVIVASTKKGKGGSSNGKYTSKHIRIRSAQAASRS